ncbi:MAG: plastocyanin/azurin family copper-binding protein [Thermoleophilaceae bacterium]
MDETVTTATRRPARRPARHAPPALAGCLTMLAFAFAGCGGDDSGDAGTAANEGGGAVTKDAGPAKQAITVDIASFKFMPDPIKVKAGGSVTFVNQDKAPHTAQTDLNAKQAEFDTDRLETGDEQTVKLTKAGRFEYFCVYHRFMEGTVEVVG